MTRALILTAATLVLAGCGVNGPPLRPGTGQPMQVQTGVTIGGTAEFGISGS